MKKIRKPCVVAFMLFSASALLLSAGCSKEQATEVAMELAFSTADEVQLGNIYARQIDTTAAFQPIDSVSALRSYIDSIGQALVKSQGTRPPDATAGFRYRFKIIDQRVMNAFAVMGGHIYIYRGLIDSCKNEAELAGVIAHELGHITKRHGVQQLIAQYGVQQLLDLILGDDPSLLKDLTGTLAGTRFSREDEYEADSCSLAYSDSAGYNAFGMRDFLAFLDSQGLDLGALEDVLNVVSTHPPTGDRITKVESILAAMGVSPSDPGYFQQRLLDHLP